MPMYTQISPLCINTRQISLLVTCAIVVSLALCRYVCVSYMPMYTQISPLWIDILVLGEWVSTRRYKY